MPQVLNQTPTFDIQPEEYQPRVPMDTGRQFKLPGEIEAMVMGEQEEQQQETQPVDQQGMQGVQGVQSTVGMMQPQSQDSENQSQGISNRGQMQLGQNTQAFGNVNPQLYGYNSQGKPNINRGADFSMKPGQPQFAPEKGNWVAEKVQTGGWNAGWGNSVVMRNTDTGETIRLSHLDKVNVKPGQKVSGMQIGTTGRTGRTTGYHADIEYTDSRGRLSDIRRSGYY